VSFNAGVEDLLDVRLHAVSGFLASVAVAPISLFGFRSGMAVVGGRCAGRISSHGRGAEDPWPAGQVAFRW
jgi:hypothetical protein